MEANSRMVVCQCLVQKLNRNCSTLLGLQELSHTIFFLFEFLLPRKFDYTGQIHPIHCTDLRYIHEFQLMFYYIV